MKLVKPTKEQTAQEKAKVRAREIVNKIKLDPSYIELSELSGENSKFEKIIADTLYEFEMMDASKL